jgi:hypothetical protein
MPAKVRRRKGHKLLAASVGVASISFVGVGCNIGVANLMAAPSCEVAPQNPHCYPKLDAGSDGVDLGGYGDASDAEAGADHAEVAGDATATGDTGDGARADASSEGDAATDTGDASGEQ